MSSTDIEFRVADGGSCGAYLALPARSPAPGLVLLQEIFGVNAVMRSVADSYAKAGYLVIVPDLFWRQEAGVQLDAGVPAQREQAMRLFKGMNEQLAVQDAASALAYLRRHPAGAGKVGAVGYCLGGKLAYLLAARSDVDASVSYYGVGIAAALGEAKSIRQPLMLHIAGRDNLCPPDAQQQIISAVSPLAGIVTTHVYPDAGHAFARPGGAEYSEPAARAADERTQAFFARHLS